MGNNYRNSITIGVLSIVVSASLIGCSSPQTTLMNGESITVVQGEQVTDSLGTYSKIKLDPSNPFLKFDKTASFVDMASLESNGFTEADAAAAQKAAVTFASTDMIDNAAVDLPANSAETFANIVGTYGTGQYLSDLSNPNSKLIYIQPDGITFARDGGTRISSVTTRIDEVAGATFKKDGLASIMVSGVTLVDYRMAPSNDNKIAQVEAGWTLRMNPDGNGNWKIVGCNSDYITTLLK